MKTRKVNYKGCAHANNDCLNDFVSYTHTPGPWKVFKGRWCTVNSGNKQVASSMTESDATLIAAAPELLEALKGVLSHPKYGPMFSTESKMELLEVISKAEVKGDE